MSNKQGFLDATVETALRRSDLRENFLHYLVNVVKKETGLTKEITSK